MHRKRPARTPAFWSGLVLLSALGAACQPKGTVTPPEAAVATSQPLPPAPADAAAAYASLDDPSASASSVRERPEVTPVDNLQDALASVAGDNPQGALPFLVEHVAKTPGDRPARLALARAQEYVGRWAEAAATLADPKGVPDDPQVVIAAAAIAERRGKTAEAFVTVSAAQAKHPDDLPLRGELLRLMGRTGKLGTVEAKSLMDGLYDAFDASRATSAEQLLAVAHAALSRRSKGGYHDANMVLEEAEAEAPAAKGSWIGDRVLLTRGDLFLKKYAHEEAAETFGLILARDSWHTDALIGMARVHMAGMRFNEATRHANEALLVAPHHPDAHVVLAEIALIEGRRDETKERLSKHVFVVNPNHRAGLAVLAAMSLFEDAPDGYAAARDRALAINPSDGHFFAHLSDILGFLHLYPESDVVLTEGIKAAPQDPYVLSALGLNQLRIGKEKPARKSLSAAWERDEFNERTHNTLELYRDNIDKNYSDEVVGNLTIRLPNEDRKFVQGGLVQSVRQSRKALDDAYKVPVGKLRVEFYADPQAFSVRTVGVPSLGALAVCFGPVITFVGPYTGAYNMDMVVRHELSHTYAIKISRGRVPRWFTEGLSEWESELLDPAYARESAELLSQARRAGKLRRLSQLELAFIRAENGMMMEVAYATSAYAVRYLGTTYGRDKLIAVLRGYGAGEPTDALFTKHLGKDLAAVEKDFERWFFGQLDQKISGWAPTEKGPGDKRDESFRAAIALAGQKDTQGSTRALQTLINAGGDGYAPRMMLAKLLLEGPKPAAAERHLRAAAKFHREAIEPLVLLANHARDTGDVDEEKKLLREALAIDGDSLEPAARMLMLGHATGDQQAIALARPRVRAIAPLHPIALCDEALRLAAAGDKRNAKAWMQRGTGGMEMIGGPSDTLVVASMAAAAAGDKDRAKKLADAARKDPKLPAAARQRLVK